MYGMCHGYCVKQECVVKLYNTILHCTSSREERDSSIIPQNITLYAWAEYDYICLELNYEMLWYPIGI
jgi:hypothetical protein